MFVCYLWCRCGCVLQAYVCVGGSGVFSIFKRGVSEWLVLDGMVMMGIKKKEERKRVEIKNLAP